MTAHPDPDPNPNPNPDPDPNPNPPFDFDIHPDLDIEHPSGAPLEGLRIAIALVERAGRYLLRVRPPGSTMPGVWEFPGGKQEPGETLARAAARETLEETGLRVRVLRLRAAFTHPYPRGPVALHYFDCQPESPDDQPLPETGFLWESPRVFLHYTFPPANTPILQQLARESENPDTDTDADTDADPPPNPNP